MEDYIYFKVFILQSRVQIAYILHRPKTDNLKSLAPPQEVGSHTARLD